MTIMTDRQTTRTTRLVLPPNGFVEQILDTEGRPAVAIWAGRTDTTPVAVIEIGEGEPDAEAEMAAAVAQEMSTAAGVHAHRAVTAGR